MNLRSIKGDQAHIVCNGKTFSLPIHPIEGPGFYETADIDIIFDFVREKANVHMANCFQKAMSDEIKDEQTEMMVALRRVYRETKEYCCDWCVCKGPCKFLRKARYYRDDGSTPIAVAELLKCTIARQRMQ